MPLLRCQAIHKSITGLPRDSVVNVFHFTTPDLTVATAELFAEMVRDFYTTFPAGAATFQLMTMFSASVALTGHEIRAYPVVEATGVDTRGEGFPPLWTEAFDHVGRVAPADSLPSEVACCLSFKNTTAGGVPAARRRGRIFFGPLADSSNTNVIGGGITRPSDVLGSRLRLAGADMRNKAQAAGGDWVIYSRPFAGRFGYVKPNGDPMPDLAARAGAVYPVTECWTDDAFDTMRSRGERATGRISLLTP